MTIFLYVYPTESEEKQNIHYTDTGGETREGNQPFQKDIENWRKLFSNCRRMQQHGFTKQWKLWGPKPHRIDNTTKKSLAEPGLYVPTINRTPNKCTYVCIY